jgi:ABC-2 type transport system permease protein
MTPAVLAVLRKEFRQIARDRRMIGILVGAPTLQLIIFGFAMNLEINRLDAVVCDLDGTARSRELVQGLLADGTFRAVPWEDCAHPEEAVRDGLAEAALVLPAGLARDAAAGRSVTLQVLADGTNPTIGRFTANALTQYGVVAGVNELAARLELASGQVGAALGGATLSAEPRLFYNPAMKSAVFMVPGVSAMILLIAGMLTAAMGLVREREVGTLEQVLVTPIRTRELLLGKLLPFMFIGFFDVLLALVLGMWVFDVPVRGALAWFWLGTFLYLLCMMGVGLLVSTVSRTQQQALMGGFFLVMPFILLSGVMTPISSMPGWLQPLTFVNPMRYYVEILRGVLLKGSDGGDLTRSFVALAVFGVAILGLAALRFSKRLR